MGRAWCGRRPRGCQHMREHACPDAWHGMVRRRGVSIISWDGRGRGRQLFRLRGCLPLVALAIGCGTVVLAAVVMARRKHGEM